MERGIKPNLEAVLEQSVQHEGEEIEKLQGYLANSQNWLNSLSEYALSYGASPHLFNHVSDAIAPNAYKILSPDNPHKQDIRAATTSSGTVFLQNNHLTQYVVLHESIHRVAKLYQKQEQQHSSLATVTHWFQDRDLSDRKITSVRDHLVEGLTEWAIAKTIILQPESGNLLPEVSMQEFKMRSMIVNMLYQHHGVSSEEADTAFISAALTENLEVLTTAYPKKPVTDIIYEISKFFL